MAMAKFRSRAKQVKFVNPGDHDPLQCNHRLNGELIHYKPARAVEGKELVKLFNNDGTRDLIVPNPKPLDLPGIWTTSELARLKTQAHVITKKDRMAMLEEAERRKAQLQHDSEQRKQQLQKSFLEQRAKPGSKLNDAETEAARKHRYLLERAFELQQEQEEEVKKATGLILATKCLAIREAQLAERALIKKEQDDEGRRLDNMMEQQRQKLLQQEERRKEIEKDKTQKFVHEIMSQIKENEVQKLMEAERIEEESRNINRALIAMQKEDEEQLRKKREEQLRMRVELKQANEEIERYKFVKKEEQRIADMRVQEFMRKKAEREAEREAEQEAARLAKEKEIARLRASQERAQNQQAALDELNALRAQEEVEREWREKERAAARKKKEQQEEMKRGREKQIEDLRKAQAMAIAKDEQHFHKVAKVQQENYEKDQAKKFKKREDAIKHRKELLKQVNEKERERINLRKEKFEEGTALQIEQEVRSLNIKEVLKKKVARLRTTNVPENYVCDIERQLKLRDDK